MKSRPAPFGRTVLISGPESLLADREVAQLVAACRAEDADADHNDLLASQLDPGSLAEATGGSLFATRSVVVIRELADLASDLGALVLDLARDTPPDLALLLVHGGGQKGKALLQSLRKVAGVEVVDVAAIKPWELSRFVTAEARRGGGKIDGATAQLLIDSVGHDLRALVAAVDQLLADGDGKLIDETLVRSYFTGRAEATGFAIADLALAGRPDAALEQLRWALATGAPHVLITSALASALRGLGKLSGLRGTGLAEGDLAREVGVPPWKLKAMRSQLRGWDDRRLAAAIAAVAAADADVKGAADNADYALERAVLAVATH